MRWHVHGERSIYASEWLEVALVDVEVPDGPRFDHHVVRFPLPAAGVVLTNPQTNSVLLLWRHRFITDTWGWEIPGGRVEAGESLIEGATREAIEESGWAPGPLRPVCSYHPTNGVSDQTFHIFISDQPTHIGDPTDPSESERIEWVPRSTVLGLIDEGKIRDGLSLTGITTAMARGLW